MYLYKSVDVYTRVLRLRELIEDIRQNGILEPVHIEVTGERLDGSFRSKIAMFLGIPEIKAVIHRFKWQDIDEDFIERKLKARQLSSGKDYYEFEYGHKDWKNVEGGPTYRENAERWETIVPLITGDSVLDLGCNEGYIAIQAARAGKKVVGIDLDWTHIAYLNKLIFEWVDKKEIPVEFIEGDILSKTTAASFDTILLLNVLYHIPREKQKEFLKQFKGKQIIFQCNLRKEAVREQYYTSHPDDLKALLDELGMPYREIPWKDKPIIIYG
jgi:2-polyprenyl-3-methyl-5-hydroxy-6-metoxy-1,4-benzoquinol methylase